MAQSQCDSCLEAEDAERRRESEEEVERLTKGETRKRRLAYADLQIANEKNILAAMQGLSSPTAKLLAQQIGQEIAINLPDSTGFVAASLKSVNNEYFTVLIGNGLLYHHPHSKIMQIVESQDGSGVPFLNQFFPLVVILEQHTQILQQPANLPTTSYGVGASIPIG